MASVRTDRISVRHLTQIEIPDMVAVWKAAGLDYKPRGRDSLKNLRRQRQTDHTFFLGAFSNGRMIGACLVSDDGRRGWINRLAVRPEARRKGVGTLLVTESERILRTKGFRLHCTHIAKDNKTSVLLFEKLGYHAEKEILYFTKRERESY